MMSSSDGSQWTQLSRDAFDLGGSWEINELAMNRSTIVGVGAGIVSGRHGRQWSWQPNPTDGGSNSVIWSGSAFWAAGRYGILTSVDGFNWVRVLLDYNLDLRDITWNGELFVAVGWDNGRAAVLTSTDGDDWSSLRLQGLDHTDPLFTVGWTGSTFVAADGRGDFLVSADGTAWDQQSFGEEIDLEDMASNGDRLVAVGGRWQVGGVILSTTDGLNWIESDLPEGVWYFDDVTWTGTHFVAVSRSSGDLIFTSTDGVSWSSESTGTGVWPVSVVGDEQSLYVTGRGLQIIRRTKPLEYRERFRRPEQRVAPDGGRARPTPPVQR
jgi:hypothetical protein